MTLKYEYCMCEVVKRAVTTQTTTYKSFKTLSDQ